MISARVSKRCLIAVVMAGVMQLVAGCSSIPDETLYCRDENNKPLEGVLVICQYLGSTFMASSTAGADYRFSDTNGVVTFKADDVTNKISSSISHRTIAFTYSPRLRSGGWGMGSYWGGQGYPLDDNGNRKNVPFIIDTAYQKEGGDTIYYLDNTKDPAAWFAVLYYLTRESRDVIGRIAGYGTTKGYVSAGVDRVEAVLVPLLKKEWDDFFREYGDTIVPAGFIEYRFPNRESRLRRNDGGALRFNDLRKLVNELGGIKEEL